MSTIYLHFILVAEFYPKRCPNNASLPYYHLPFCVTVLMCPSQVIIGAPTVEQRAAILSVLCERMPVCPSVDMAELARRTTGYVGADLSALCREAAMQAIRHNTQVGNDSSQTTPGPDTQLNWYFKGTLVFPGLGHSGFRRAGCVYGALPGGPEGRWTFLPERKSGQDRAVPSLLGANRRPGRRQTQTPTGVVAAFKTIHSVT